MGTSPQDVCPVTGIVPDPSKEKDEDRKEAMQRSLDYMGLKANTKIADIKIDKDIHRKLYKMVELKI